ncbi:MAG TPA: U32 family peptidase [Methanosarcinales archaeon]|nr:U32 family peptidase [Methanosarcinales archaeon]
MKKKLYVPYPGHFDGLKELISEAGKDIYSVYMAGSPDYIGTGRSNLSAPQIEDIREQTEYAHKHGVKMEIVLNSTCMGGRQLTPEGFNLNHWYLEKLDECGIDTIVVADPYLVETIARDFDMRVVVSVLSFVSSPQKAELYEELGASSIVLDPDENRHFEVLHAIRDAVDCELKLLVNEGCLYQGPFRYAHFNFFSHAFGPPPRPNVLDDYYHHKCISMRIKNPELIITSPWIRPEDIREYAEITDVFKIGGRTHYINWVLNCLRAYTEETYDGNLMNILDCPKELRDLFYISNRDLDGVIDHWKECPMICNNCGFCKELTDKFVYMYTGGGTENEALTQWSKMAVCA